MYQQVLETCHLCSLTAALFTGSVVSQAAQDAVNIGKINDEDKK